ncbi:MAG: hypothetical protein IPF71_18205 [Rhodoferax sp.]|nr:hypothetical protein [Rhodoferax sp.]
MRITQPDANLRDARGGIGIGLIAKKTVSEDCGSASGPGKLNCSGMQPVPFQELYYRYYSHSIVAGGFTARRRGVRS